MDLTTTGHDLALVFGFEGPLQLTLAGGQNLLTDVTHPAGESLQLGLRPGPVASFQVPVPNLPALAGLSLSTQAVQLGGVTPFALSNAQDWTLGF